MIKATISPNGEIPIPKTIRDQFHLEPGAQVAIDVEGEQVVLRRLASGSPEWRTMRGMFRGAADLHEELAQERAVELAKDDARLQSS